MVLMPCASCTAAAAMASSRRSPGMKADTDRRTNAVFVARSRSQALVDIASNNLRATDMPGDCTAAADSALRCRADHAGDRRAAAVALENGAVAVVDAAGHTATGNAR